MRRFFGKLYVQVLIGVFAGVALGSAQFPDYLARWVDAYPIVTIEDGNAGFTFEVH